MSAVLPDSAEDLLELAWASEPGLRLTARSAALDALEVLLTRGGVTDGPGRNWRFELLAERAVDAARVIELDTALRLADEVLAAPDAGDLAKARATEARGRAVAWAGTDAATRRAEGILLEAVDRYAALGRTEWQGYALFCLGNAVHLQHGELMQAARCMEHALLLLSPDSPRRATVLTFYADLLIALSEWHRAELALGEAETLAVQAGDDTGAGYAAWSRARMASARGDALATARYLLEAEREAADWFNIHTGPTFLADAAELLDRVGNRDQAEDYLARAVERATADDPYVRQARAALLARAGDPQAALDALNELSQGRWIEKRLRWRHTLLTAWATFRAGGTGAGELAARALDLAVASGSIEVAAGTEPDLVLALAPLAELAGSEPARELLLSGGELMVRLLGEPRFVRADGTEVVLPAGQAAELVRMVALHPYGVAVEVVLDRFFPGVAEQAARHRLRQLLSKLRSARADIIVRTGDRLSLVPSWVDVRAFQAAADRVRSARGSRATQLAYAALAIWSGPPLPMDEYAEWAESIHDRLRHRYLNLLDLVAQDATRRESHAEALSALTTMLDEDPDDPSRYRDAIEHLRALDRHRTAEHFARRADQQQ